MPSRIGGTSTGGIIAILLSRLRLDCKRCISIYTKLAEEIFRYDKSMSIFGMKIPTGTSRFSGVVLERSIKQALVDLGYDPDELMWDDSLFEELPESELSRDSIWSDVAPDILTESPVATASNQVNLTRPSPPHGTNIPDEQLPPAARDDPLAMQSRSKTDTWKLRSRLSVHKKKNVRGCRGFVLTSLKNALGLPRILSTYDPNDRTTRIWEALRATSAAPTFFEEMQFGSPKVTYLDGGVGFNNPCAEVDYAAKALWEGRPIGVIVSVGTGLQSIPSVRKVASWLPFGLGTDIALVSALASMATSTQRVDNEMKRMYYSTSTQYYRFDVDRGLANVSLEQWMKEDEMAALTEQYMRDARQMRTTRQFGALMAKLSALPPTFGISATHFKVGMDGHGLIDKHFKLVQVDFKTGFPLGVVSTLKDQTCLVKMRDESPSGESGVAFSGGRLKRIFPVAEDLDNDGRREEATVFQCVGTDNVCLRTIKTGIPQGRYRVQFIVSFQVSRHTPPHDLVFSVGKPLDASTFTQRFVDANITPDIVPVLLHPDAVRVRVGKKRYEEGIGKLWQEIEGDVEANVGLDGALGFIISKKYEEGVIVDGWSFGGVKLQPVFSKIEDTKKF